MSAKQNPTTKITKTTKTSTAAKRARGAARTAPPWVEGGIDYGPALVAIDELIAWAFDLAAASVPDRESKRRVKNARRLVVARMRGKAAPAGGEADVLFTATVLARALDADLGLGLGAIVEVFTELGLPIDDVPQPPRRPARARAPQPMPSAAELAGVLEAIQRGAGRAPVAPAAPVVPVIPIGRPRSRAVVAPCAGCHLARPGFAFAA